MIKLHNGHVGIPFVGDSQFDFPVELKEQPFSVGVGSKCLALFNTCSSNGIGSWHEPHPDCSNQLLPSVTVSIAGTCLVFVGGLTALPVIMPGLALVELVRDPITRSSSASLSTA